MQLNSKQRNAVIAMYAATAVIDAIQAQFPNGEDASQEDLEICETAVEKLLKDLGVTDNITLPPTETWKDILQVFKEYLED